MSRIYGSPLTKVALMIRIWYHVPNSKKINVLFFTISIKNLRLRGSRDTQKLGSVIREINIVYLEQKKIFKPTTKTQSNEKNVHDKSQQVPNF